MTRYYHKSVISSPIFGLPFRVQWLPIDNGHGITSESRDDMNAALQAKIAAGVGGLTELTEAEFLEKKKLSEIPRRFTVDDPRFVRPRVMNLRVSGFKPRSVPEAASPAGKSDSSASSVSAISPAVKASEPEVGRLSVESFPEEP